MLSHLRTGLSRLIWLRGEPQPVMLQIGFSLLVADVLGLRALGGVADRWSALALVASVAIAVLTCLTPVGRMGRGLTVIAILDLVVIGLGMVGEVDGAGLLVVLPALWLGRQHGWRGSLVAAVGTTLLISGPGLLAHGLSSAPITYFGLLPTIAGVSALSMAAGLDVARRAQARAERHEAELCRALQTIEAQRQSAQAIFDAADVGLMLLDERGQPVRINQRYVEAVRLIELGAREGYGEVGPPGHIYAADGLRQLLPEELPSVRAGRGEEFDGYRLWYGPPGRRRAVSASARRISSDLGDFRGAAVAITDVTEIMRALEVKDEFIALVSHELRTPLTSIIGYVSLLLEEGELPPLATKQLTVVARNGERLHRLVADLLDQAQASAGSIELELEETDIVAIVRCSVQAASASAAAAGVTLVCDAADAPLHLAVDARRLAQVIDNLVSNAIKYTPTGGVARVSVVSEDDVVEVRVADTGIGISEADRAQLFTRFFRSQAATEMAIPGAGLGLSISKSIVESHGGFIEVDSRPGEGSEFRVRLPLAAS